MLSRQVDTKVLAAATLYLHLGKERGANEWQKWKDCNSTKSGGISTYLSTSAKHAQFTAVAYLSDMYLVLA